MEEQEKTIRVVKTLFKSMRQSLEDIEKADFEMNLSALAEKAKVLVGFVEGEVCQLKAKAH